MYFKLPYAVIQYTAQMEQTQLKKRHTNHSSQFAYSVGSCIHVIVKKYTFQAVPRR